MLSSKSSCLEGRSVRDIESEGCFPQQVIDKGCNITG